MCSNEGRDDCQQLKPKVSHASFATTVIAVTILLMLSILFSRVTVNVLVFVLHFVFFVTRYMCDARRRDFALSAIFVSELDRFVGSEVTGDSVTVSYFHRPVISIRVRWKIRIVKMPGNAVHFRDPKVFW